MKKVMKKALLLTAVIAVGVLIFFVITYFNSGVTTTKLDISPNNGNNYYHIPTNSSNKYKIVESHPYDVEYKNGEIDVILHYKEEVE